MGLDEIIGPQPTSIVPLEEIDEGTHYTDEGGYVKEDDELQEPVDSVIEDNVVGWHYPFDMNSDLFKVGERITIQKRKGYPIADFQVSDFSKYF